MARRGPETLRYGPMRPIGLRDPRNDKNPFAVIQLRAETGNGTLYNLVGFQTRLNGARQRKSSALVPALREAVFAASAPCIEHLSQFAQVLEPSLRIKARMSNCAGQLTARKVIPRPSHRHVRLSMILPTCAEIKASSGRKPPAWAR